MNTLKAMDMIAINTLETKLRSVSVQGGCALMFSHTSDVGNEALRRILVECLGYSDEFFEIIVMHTCISAYPKFKGRNWSYIECVKITRYAAGGGNKLRTEGYTFMEAIREGCEHLRSVTLNYVRPNVEEANLITKFATRYMQ
jgi:hypothetical protein